MARYLPTKSVVYMLFLILLIGAGFIGWFVIKYPASTGYTQYETRIPAGFDFHEAERALISSGYSVESYYDTTFYEDSYLWITDPSDANVDVSLMVEERYDRIEITARRDVYILPYEVFSDLDAVSVEQHEIAVEDMREVMAVIGLPSTGEFTHMNESDSLDYFIPTSALYVLVFGHLPLMILTAVTIVNERNKDDAPFQGQEFYYNRTQY